MWYFFAILLITETVFTKEVSNVKEIPALRKNNSYVRSEQELLIKINKIIHDGPGQLQIVTDFDNTLTADNGIDGKPVLNSFEMFRKCPSVPKSYKDEEYKLYLRYKPVENDPYLSVEEKSKQLSNWYMEANNLMKGLKFPKQELRELARNVTSSFRDGIDELLNWADVKKVPILVLSSGLGEAVVDCLEAANFSSSQMKVISNFLEVDSNDIIVGMKGSPIHSFNKNEASIKNTEYYQEVRGRSNVILMGDSTGDASMVDGMENINTVIKIGFLSEKRQLRLVEYMNIFDVVLQNDQTMNMINDIIKEIN